MPSGSTDQPGVVDELDIFSNWPPQFSHLEVAWHDFPSLSNLDQPSVPIEFYVPGTTDAYTQLSDSYLKIKFKVQKLNAEGKIINLQPADKVSVVNNFGHALFDKMELYLNNVLVSNSNSHYSYRNYIELLTSYGKDYISSQATRQLFYKDDAGDFDTMELKSTQKNAQGEDVEVSVNDGFIFRNHLIKSSRECEIEIRPNLSLFLQNRPILNNVNLRLKGFRSTNNFCLLAPNDNTKYVVVITEAIFRVKRIIPSDDILATNEAHLLKNMTARYPINRYIEKQHHIPQGQSSFMWDNIFLNSIPARIVTFQIESSALSGDIIKNPYKLNHFKINKFNILKDGVCVTGQKNPLYFNFERGLYLDGYTSLFRSTDTNFKDLGIIIDRHDYASDSYFMVITDLSRDGSGGLKDWVDLTYSGSLRLEMSYNVPIPSPTTIYILAYQKRTIDINSDRDIITNF